MARKRLETGKTYSNILTKNYKLNHLLAFAEIYFLGTITSRPPM